MQRCFIFKVFPKIILSFRKIGFKAEPRELFCDSLIIFAALYQVLNDALLTLEGNLISNNSYRQFISSLREVMFLCSFSAFVISSLAHSGVQLVLLTNLNAQC